MSNPSSPNISNALGLTSLGLSALIAAYGVNAVHTATKITENVVHVEQGYVNNPKDPGGATNHGITNAVARKHGYEGLMQDLPKDTAFSIYIKDYIEKPGYFPLVQDSYPVAWKVIDAGVNAGTGRSSVWFQTSLNALNRNGRDYASIAEDGRVGPATYAAWNQLKKKRGAIKACEMVIKLMDAQQATHYMNLYKAKPHQFGEFMVGWVDHRIGIVPLSECAV